MFSISRFPEGWLCEVLCILFWLDAEISPLYCAEEANLVLRN